MVLQQLEAGLQQLEVGLQQLVSGLQQLAGFEQQLLVGIDPLLNCCYCWTRLQLIHSLSHHEKLRKKFSDGREEATSSIQGQS